MIEVTINGEKRVLENPIKLMEYLESLSVNIDHVAVAYNGEVLHKEKYVSVIFKHLDRIEIVRAVGGG